MQRTSKYQGKTAVEAVGTQEMHISLETPCPQYPVSSTSRNLQSDGIAHTKTHKCTSVAVHVNIVHKAVSKGESNLMADLSSRKAFYN